MTPAIASLGLFILDQFEWRNPDGSLIKTAEELVVGGGGTYAMIGSRMWLPPTSIGLVVDRGNDWPAEVQLVLNGFGSMWHYRSNDRPTTRALNLYTGEQRAFQYLNPRRRLEPIDLPSPLLASRFLHFVCSPSRALIIHSQLAPLAFDPALIYEPIPDRCIPEELDALRTILPHIAVFSPNHEEGSAFFGIEVDEVERRGKDGIEEVARRFVREGAGGAVVIRSGRLGAFGIGKGVREGGVWVPAYWENGDKVVDVTGAGNSFLGGLMAGMELYDGDVKKAMQLGSVSASFIIEQFGLAKLEKDEQGVERWNGAKPMDRLAELQAREEQE